MSTVLDPALREGRGGDRRDTISPRPLIVLPPRVERGPEAPQASTLSS